MKITSLLLISLFGIALGTAPAAAQSDDRGPLWCTGELGGVTYQVYPVGGAGMAADVVVPGFGEYRLTRGAGGWLTGPDGISFNQFSSPRKLKDSNNGNGREFDCR
jgi:hypothetical protein